MKPYDFSQCNQTHIETTASKKKKVKGLLPQLFQNNLLCAGSVIGTQGSCNGDSGGPLMIYNIGTKQWTQIAIVEGGIGKFFKVFDWLQNSLMPWLSNCWIFWAAIGNCAPRIGK